MKQREQVCEASGPSSSHRMNAPVGQRAGPGSLLTPGLPCSPATEGEGQRQSRRQQPSRLSRRLSFLLSDCWSPVSGPTEVTAQLRKQDALSDSLMNAGQDALRSTSSGSQIEGAGDGGGGTSQDGRGWRCILEDGRGCNEQRGGRTPLVEGPGLSKDLESGM